MIQNGQESNFLIEIVSDPIKYVMWFYGSKETRKKERSQRK